MFRGYPPNRAAERRRRWALGGVLMSSAVAHALPPSILALFAPRAPLVYKPPISKNAPFSTKRPKLKCVALRLNSGPSTHTQPWDPVSLRWSSLERL